MPDAVGYTSHAHYTGIEQNLSSPLSEEAQE